MYRRLYKYVCTYEEAVKGGGVEVHSLGDSWRSSRHLSSHCRHLLQTKLATLVEEGLGFDSGMATRGGEGGQFGKQGLHTWEEEVGGEVEVRASDRIEGREEGGREGRAYSLCGLFRIAILQTRR